MNTIQCPVCKQELEGGFQMTDTVKCPACETVFTPSKLVSAQNMKEENNSESSSVRPKEIGWLVTSWMTVCALREILLSSFLVVSIAAGNMVLFETLIGPFMLGVVVLPVAVFVAWKVFKGNNWARIVYNVCAPLGILQNSIQAFGMKVLSASPLYVSPLPNWFQNLNVFWALGIIVVHICGLWWINKEQSIRWFKEPKQTQSSRPWWIWIVSLLILCDLIVVSFGVTFNKSEKRKPMPVISPKQDTGASVLSPHPTTTTTTTRPLVSQTQRNQNVTQNSVANGDTPVQCMKEQSASVDNGILSNRLNVNSEQLSNEIRIALPGQHELIMIHCPKIRSGFYVGKFEVTIEQWKAITGMVPNSSDSEEWKAAYPVTNVSMRDIDSFLRSLNRKTANQGLSFRLPTKEEWMKACAAGSKGRFGQIEEGYEGELFELGWFKGNSRSKHHVGEKEPNSWGLYDMHGNVWERTKELNEEEDDDESNVDIASIFPVAPRKLSIAIMRMSRSGDHLTSYSVSHRGTVATIRNQTTKNGRFRSVTTPIPYEMRHPRPTEYAPYTPIIKSRDDRDYWTIQERGWKTTEHKFAFSEKLETGLAGGCYKSAEKDCEITSYLSVRRDFQGEDVGFRLVAERHADNVSLSHGQLAFAVRRNGIDCLEKGQQWLDSKNFDEAIEQLHKASQYFSNEAIPKSDPTTKKLLEQAHTGLAEAYYQKAVVLYQRKQFKSALSSCSEARRFSHPKAYDLFVKIQKAEQDSF